MTERNRQDRLSRLESSLEACADDIEAATAMLGGDPADIAYGIVPRQDRPLIPLPEQRRAEFAARLEAIAATAFAENPSTGATDRNGEGPEDPLMSAACATCQGRCCLRGAAQHAFLTTASIQRFRGRNPEATQVDVTAHYLAHLPARSVEDSCVYHGDDGCVLPRTDRADICNAFHCEPQIQLGRRFYEMGATRALIVANDDGAATALGIYEPSHGWRRFETEAPTAGTAEQRTNTPVRSSAMAAVMASADCLPPPK